MSEHGQGVIEFFFGVFYFTKVFKNAWLMMSSIFVLYFITYTGKLLNWKVILLLILKLKIF